MFKAEDIEKWLTDIFNGMSDMVNGICEQLIMSPGVAFGEEFWSKLLDICSKVFMPFALTLLGFFLAAEMYNVYCRTNGEIDIQLVTVTIVKFAFPFIICTKTYDVINLVYKAFNSIIINLNTQLLVDKTQTNNGTVEEIMKFVNEMGFGERMMFSLQLLIVWLVITAMQIIIMVIVYGRIFEIMLFWLVSPLPMATLVHNEHNQIGKNYLKMFIALLIQGVLILLCVVIFSMLSQTIITTDAIGAILQLVGYSAILIVTITKVGQLAKRMLGTF